MGLGAVSEIDLVTARQLLAKWHSVRNAGVDPIEERKRQDTAAPGDQHTSLNIRASFREVAASYIKSRVGTWRNNKSEKQWSSTIRNYVYPHIGELCWSDVRTSHVVRVLSIAAAKLILNGLARSDGSLDLRQHETRSCARCAARTTLRREEPSSRSVTLDSVGFDQERTLPLFASAWRRAPALRQRNARSDLRR